MGFTIALATAWTLAGPAPGAQLATRDGGRFDTGHEMAARAPGAPPELDQVASFVGQWDVEVSRPQGDEAPPIVTSGRAEITFMNRGHALMGTLQSADLGDSGLASMFFLGYNPAAGRWWLGGADSRSESAWVADGTLDGSRLSLSDTRRLNGGVARTDFRYTFAQPAPDALSYAIETSNDGGATWTPVEQRTYRRRPWSAGFMTPASLYGSPDPARSAAAAGFDFLIGEWTVSNDMTFPNGQQVQWSANGTGVYALNGAAVMEFNWFDIDPNLPDAATTILRIYNRAMRRWECLYVPNRGHSILYFGGRQEGDRIILGNFTTDASAPTISRYVFHSIAKDSYAWYAESSQDRGDSWTKTWLIEGRRKEAGSEAP